MSEDQFKSLLQRLDNIQSTVNRTDKDADHIWKDNQDLTIRIGNLENRIEELRTTILSVPQKTKDKVEDVVQSVVDGTKDLKDTIESKKVLPLKPLKKSWFKFW
jgi:septal ring factor EnvC (AmiA/AmiB activator)